MKSQFLISAALADCCSQLFAVSTFRFQLHSDRFSAAILHSGHADRDPLANEHIFVYYSLRVAIERIAVYQNIAVILMEYFERVRKLDSDIFRAVF